MPQNLGFFDVTINGFLISQKVSFLMAQQMVLNDAKKLLFNVGKNQLL